MISPHLYTRSRPGFTLVELLAVMAILGVLVALTLQSVGGLRRSAHASQCLSNLRQIGVGIHRYAADNNNELPFGYIKNSGTYWSQIIYPYLDPRDSTKTTGKGTPSNRVFFCPAESVKPSPTSDRTNYIGNPQLMPEDKRVPSDPSIQSSRYSIAAISQPASTILVTDGTVNASGHADWGFYSQPNWSNSSKPADTPVENKTTDGTSRMSWRHNGNVNVLFADGSATSFAEGDLKLFHLRRNK